VDTGQDSQRSQMLPWKRLLSGRPALARHGGNDGDELHY